MKLCAELLKKISRGAVRVEERDGYLYFFRFTKEQEEMYRQVSADFYKKTFSPAGIMLDFVTDSRFLVMKGEMTPAASRSFYSFDVFVDGSPIEYIDNMAGTDLPKNYSSMKYEVGKLDAKIALGEGKKCVTVYFPWSVVVRFTEISIDDGALIEPTEVKKKILVFGDSITHGYDSMRPSAHHVHRLCQTLNLEQVNKAMGAEIYRPALAELADDFTPEFITVAYGTNDWASVSREQFKENCEKFLRALRANYKDVKIIVLSPIWRKSFWEPKPIGSFFDVEKLQREIASGIENVYVVSGFDFVPHSPDYFGDLSLHPNDKGFEHYFTNLLEKLKEIL